ncbi:hypothetical protein HOE67_00625 [Candidatus Peregrinibacteria bacterium]|jgi:hypothetical protein|nr:hypothetical protein [Candidatus Peregrinibacteria bacterium]MBT4055594.1 hypothetical protein [Candidatus Peregrinibacteria bacterium]
MDYKKLIRDSWLFTQSNKKLIYWFGFIPSLLTTTVGIGYITYQFFAFQKSYLFENADHSFAYEVINFGWEFVKQHASWSVPLVIVGIVIAVLYFLVPTLFKAAAIQAIAREKNGQKSGVGIGLKYGLMAFLPLFEYHLLVGTFSWISMLTESSFVIRNLGMGLFQMMMPVFIVIFILSIFLTLLFTFADLFIVIDDEKVLASMRKSAKLVFMNWQHTLLITILMIIIGVRIIIQALFVFLIPGAVIFAVGYMTTLALGTPVLIIAGLVGVLGLFIAAYLGGVVDIFSYAVWTFAFLELTSEKEVSARDKVSARDVVSGGDDDDDAPPLGTAPKGDLGRLEDTTPKGETGGPTPDQAPSEDNIPGLL